jgi:hypothetical protein
MFMLPKMTTKTGQISELNRMDCHITISQDNIIWNADHGFIVMFQNETS